MDISEHSSGIREELRRSRKECFIYKKIKNKQVIENEKLRKVNASTLRGVGDDAAVLDPGQRQVLVSSDMLVEGVHFDLSYTR